MKHLTWPLIAVVTVFALGVVSALAITDHTEQRAVIRAQAATSAATTITVFLLTVILVLVLATIGTVVGSQWWKRRRRRERLEEAAQQAYIYTLLQGARSPRTSARRAGVAGLPQAGGNILVFPGSGQQPTPQLMVDDLRAMGQPDPLAGLLPPDDGRWEVL